MTTEQLIEHVENAIAKASNHESRLPESTCQIHGLMSLKVRHLLNNLCSRPNTVYLEAGLWNGASLVSALAGNEDTVDHAYGIDNWINCAWGRDAKGGCERSIAEHLDYGDRLTVFDHDLFDFDVSNIRRPVNVFYFDADHLRTKEGVVHFADALDNTCIIILDDWDTKKTYNIEDQWRAVEPPLPFTIVREWELHSRHKSDAELWWCGMYVAILKRVKNEL